MNRLPLTGWLALALLLPGCSLTRPPARAEAPVPAQWLAPRPPPLPHGGAVPALAAWWRDAGDPLLAELVEAAQAASPTLASAAARIAEARAARVQAGAAGLPALDGQLALSRGNALSGAAGGGSATLPTFTTAQAGLQAGWELDLFGGLAAGRDAADARLAASQAQWHEARVAVAAETANAVFAERACRRQLAVAEQDAGSRRDSARLTELSARAGFAAPADAALARAGAADASARLRQQRTQCALQLQALAALTAWDAPRLQARLAAADAEAEAALPAALQPVAAVPAQALAQRPDVYAAELAVAAASADVGAAEAQRYPRLSLAGSITAARVRGAGVSESLQTWSIGPLALSLPLFDAGQRAADAEAAHARYGEAAAQYRARVRQAVREVEDALQGLDGTAARTGDADEAVRQYQASLDAVQARRDAGLASQFELEDARRALFAAQTARVALQRERAEAFVALYRALGGGWQRPDAAAAALPPSPAP
ncbi:efflux transporter outer membrane subunit [Pseudorhodoferax sp.]|uniref:efflux transporter outer membrane subunit n=1 Tax=Pseudorhodoferax sp. TaxID=1993553 RepID=UPI0039E43D03